MADKNPEEMSLEELEAAIDQETKTEADPAAKTKEPEEKESEEIEVKLETGQVYKGKTKDEIMDKLAKAETEATKAIRDRDEQIRNLTAALASKASSPTTAKAAERKMDESFDSSKYYELLQKDPLAAETYILEHNPTVQALVQKLARIDEGVETYNFQVRNQDYPATKEASAAIMARMEAEGRSWTADNLEIVFNTLKREGTVKPLEAKKEAEEEVKTPKPPPTVRGESFQQEAHAQIEQLSDADLEKLLRKKGLLVT